MQCDSLAADEAAGQSRDAAVFLLPYGFKVLVLCEAVLDLYQGGRGDRVGGDYWQILFMQTIHSRFGRGQHLDREASRKGWGDCNQRILGEENKIIKVIKEKGERSGEEKGDNGTMLN